MHEVVTQNADSYHYVSRKPGMSEALYRRACHDPFDSIDPLSEEFPILLKESTDGLAESLNSGNRDDAIVFSTDIAYLKFFGGNNAVGQECALSLSQLAEKLRDPTISAVQRLRTEARIVDLAELRSFTDYTQASTTLGPEDKNTALALREAQLKSTILASLGFLKSAHKNFVAETDGEVRGEILGAMFELLYSTNTRRHIYEKETYDEVVVLGSTDMQDFPMMIHTPRRHNFDVLEVDSRGNVLQVTQLKASRNLTTRDGKIKQERLYDDRIVGISGKSFAKFLDNPQIYIDGLRHAVENSPLTTEQMIVEGSNLVDSLFVKHTRRLGESALIGSTTT
jgi:hypothetical protein